MAAAPLGTLVRRLQHLAGNRSSPERGDRQLLEEFAFRREEAAFAALVARHGNMVLRVCRRVLHHEQDAEDAFQATFLVLARNVGSIRKRESLAPWLHGVAYRTAMEAKRKARRRRFHEARLRARDAGAPSNPSWNEVQAVLDDEIQHLPGALRTAFVLCVLEGKSGPQAAAELGVKEGTVSSRLARARHHLRQRLARRGIQLASLLAALCVAESAGRAAVTASLAQATLRIGLVGAAGGTAAGTIPVHVADLATGVTRAMALTKAKIATAVLLTACLLAEAGALAHRAFAAREEAVPDPETPLAASSPAPKQQARASAPAGAEDPDAVTYAGRVVGPDGNPIAGAKVYYHFITREVEPVAVRAVTDSQGRFSFRLTRQDVPLSADAVHRDPRKFGQVVVKADGYTLAWRDISRQQGDLGLHLARDNTPVEGRIIDLQGKPVAGLRVTALSAAASEKGDLSGLQKAIQAGEPFYTALFHNAENVLMNPIIGRRVDELLPSTTTDARGGFHLPGFAPEQVVQLRIEGKGVETQDVYVVTHMQGRDSKRLLSLPRMKDPVFGYGAPVLVLANGFELAVAPGLTVVGTVTDRATGEPVPGAAVETYQLAGSKLGQNSIYRTVADGQGRYRLEGLPRGEGNRLRIRPPRGRPYLPVVKLVPPARTFAAATADAALPPGVWVDVTATDKATGKPVSGYVSYFALPEKQTPENRFRRPYADAYDDMMAIHNDGTFRFAAAPGKAVIAFKADWERYPIAREAATIWLPSGLSASNFQAFARIDPKPGDAPIRVAFRLDAGRVVAGKLVGPDGRPVAGALAGALRDDWFWDPIMPLKTDAFTAIGLDPARPRLLCFAERGKKLAGSVVVRGDEKGPLTVRLQPWATVAGRLLDADGKPIINATLAFTQVPVRKPGQPMSTTTGLYVITHFAGQPSLDPKTDAQGRFRVEGLIPGLKYNLALYDAKGIIDFDRIRWEGLAFHSLVLDPNESRDLGDVKLQPFPKE